MSAPQEDTSDFDGISIDMLGLVDDDPEPAEEETEETPADDAPDAPAADTETPDDNADDAEEGDDDEPEEEAPKPDPEADKVTYKVNGEERTESVEGFASLPEASKARVTEALRLSAASQQRFDEAAKLRKEAERIEDEHKQDRQAVAEFTVELSDPERFEDAIAALGEKHREAFRKAAYGYVLRVAEREKMSADQRQALERNEERDRQLREREYRIQLEEAERKRREDETKAAADAERRQNMISWLRSGVEAVGLQTEDEEDMRRRGDLVVLEAQKLHRAGEPITAEIFAKAAASVAAFLGIKKPEPKAEAKPKPKTPPPPPKEGIARKGTTRKRRKPKTVKGVFGAIDDEYDEIL